MQMVEKEYHFLLVCPKHTEIRNKYLKLFYCRWPLLRKFENLLTKSSKELIGLGKYVYFALCNRQRN
jgi:hypothetical protein